jgi:hypothetical protein
MALFIATLEDPEIVDRLQIAIIGKGAFRRFKDVLSRWPEELSRYFLLRDEVSVAGSDRGSSLKAIGQSDHLGNSPEPQALSATPAMSVGAANRSNR